MSSTESAGTSSRYVWSAAVCENDDAQAGRTSLAAPIVVSIVMPLVICVTPSVLMHDSLGSPADEQVVSIGKSIFVSLSLSAPSPHSGQFTPTPGHESISLLSSGVL